MARRPSATTPTNANLREETMRALIPKIRKRISDVEAFDPDTIRDRSDPKITALEHRLESLLDTVFPVGTIEHARYHYQVTTLDRASLQFGGTSLDEVIEGLREGKDAIIVHLNEIINQFNEELEEEVGSQQEMALRAYKNLELHPKIQRAAGKLYEDGHYANAIEDAVKALNELVRLRSGLDDKDGNSLMEYVFNPSRPVLKFNNLADQSDKDEQKGFMMMFSGAVAGLRNPRAHKIIKDDPERALEFIAYISLLAKLVDEAIK